MFPRVLLKNETWLMTIAWLGVGKLEVSHYPTGRNAIAPVWLKSHFINTMHSLSTRNVSIGPDSSIAVQTMETYAEFVLNPQGLMTRAALLQTPEQFAEAILLESSSASDEQDSIGSTLQSFINEAQGCAQNFFENANYIQKELPNVTMTENLRQSTSRMCDTLKTTRDDVFAEIQTWKGTSFSWHEFSHRIDKVVNTLSRDINELHALATSLRVQTDIDQRSGLASMLVEESATNIYQSFNRVADLAKDMQNASRRT